MLNDFEAPRKVHVSKPHPNSYGQDLPLGKYFGVGGSIGTGTVTSPDDSCRAKPVKKYKWALTAAEKKMLEDRPLTITAYEEIDEEIVRVARENGI